MVQEPAKLSPKVVGQEFVRQYYTMLAKEPRYLHRFYGSHSEMMHGARDENAPAVGQVKIREKIKALDFKDVYAKVAQLDAFMTIGNGICIQVAGEISNNQEPLRRFMQTFVLGPQDHDGKAPGTSFYVHNDIFRYQDDIFAEPELMMEPAAGDAPIEVESNYQAEEIVAEEIDETPIVQAPEPVQEIIEEPVVVVEEVKEPEPEPVAEPEPEVVEPVVEEVEPVVEEEVVEEEPEPPLQKPVQVAAAASTPMAPPPQQQQQQKQQHQPQQPSAPLSWAARMRTGGGAAPVLAAPVSTPQTAKDIPNGSGSTTGSAAPSEPEFPPVQASAQSSHHLNGSSSAPSAAAKEPQGPKETTKHESSSSSSHRSGENGGAPKERGYTPRGEYNSDRGPRSDRYNDDKQQIFVGGLPFNITEDDLRTVFNNYGQVKHVRITNRGHQGGSQSAGFGFVTYHKESEARNALNNDGGIYFKNMALNVEEKKTRGDRPPRDGFRGGGQNGGYKPRGDGRGNRDNRGGGGDYQPRSDGPGGQRAQGRQSYGGQEGGRRGDRARGKF